MMRSPQQPIIASTLLHMIRATHELHKLDVCCIGKLKSTCVLRINLLQRSLATSFYQDQYFNLLSFVGLRHIPPGLTLFHMISICLEDARLLGHDPTQSVRKDQLGLIAS
jgi:hypothetical protein